MQIEIEEIRLVRRAIANMKPEWRVVYRYKGDMGVQWIHADDEVGVYAALLRGYADASN